MTSKLLLLIFIYFSVLISVRADLSYFQNDKDLEKVNKSWLQWNWTMPHFNTTAMNQRSTIPNSSVEFDTFALLRSLIDTSYSYNTTYWKPWYITEPVSKKTPTDQSQYTSTTNELNYTETPWDADTTYSDWTSPGSNIIWGTEPDSTTGQPWYTSRPRYRWTTSQYDDSNLNWTTSSSNRTPNGNIPTNLYWYSVVPNSNWTLFHRDIITTNRSRLWYTPHWNQSYWTTTNRTQYTRTFRPRWTTAQYRASSPIRNRTWNTTTSYSNWTTPSWNGTLNGDTKTTPYWFYSRWTTPYRNTSTTKWDRLWYLTMPYSSRTTPDWKEQTEPDSTTTQYTRTFRPRWTTPQYIASSPIWNRTWNRITPYSSWTTPSWNETMDGDTKTTPNWFNSRWTTPSHRTPSTNWNRPWNITLPHSTPNWNVTSNGTKTTYDSNSTTTNWNRILRNKVTTPNWRNTTTTPQQLVNINMGIKIIIIQNNTNVNVNIN